MSSIDFIKVEETATLPESVSDCEYKIFSNEQVSLEVGQVKRIHTGVAFAPPADCVCTVEQLQDAQWRNIKNACGAGKTKEIEIVIENTTENVIEISTGDAIGIIRKCERKEPTPSVTDQQMLEILRDIDEKLNRSSKGLKKKIV